ncbi:hypothetical protein HDU91_006922 [Kappamyces sp. JEL0680]|nr:hypothetical protein HDU91_006922 [Kappamyces sp. JEL0680]
MSSVLEDPELDVQLMHVAYSPTGDQFVTCASDNNIRVYDGHTHKQVFSSSNIEEHGSIGHTNRIFCAKFHPKSPDDTIQIWDTRVPNPVRRIFSPRICGDSIDFNDRGTTLLTGSYRKENNLQVWDWASGKLLDTVAWSHDDLAAPNSMVYSASYSKKVAADSKESYILAGGHYKAVGSVNNLNCAVYSTAMSTSNKMVVLGGGGKMIILSDVLEETEDEK